jgi:hypothetical protein
MNIFVVRPEARFWDFDWQIPQERRHLYKDDAITCERCNKAFLYPGVGRRRIDKTQTVMLCHACADEDSFICCKCKRVFYDIGVSLMLTAIDNVVTVCHVCKRGSRDLYTLPALPERKYSRPKGPPHDYYNAVLIAPLDCECIWCCQIPQWLKLEERGKA